MASGYRISTAAINLSLDFRQNALVGLNGENFGIELNNIGFALRSLTRLVTLACYLNLLTVQSSEEQGK